MECMKSARHTKKQKGTVTGSIDSQISNRHRCHIGIDFRLVKVRGQAHIDLILGQI